MTRPVARPGRALRARACRSLVALLLVAAGCGADQAPGHEDTAGLADAGEPADVEAEEPSGSDADAAESDGESLLDAGPEISHDASAEPPLVFGRLTYLDHPYDEDGFLDERVPEPMAFIAVEAVRILDGVVLATAETDADGRFELDLGGYALTPIRLEVPAEVVGEHYSVEVVERDRWDTQRIVDDRFILSEGGQRRDLQVEATSSAKALNILDVVRRGLEFAIAVDPDGPPELPHLIVVWEEGISSPCGTCYGGNRIDLQGSPDDPDGYDDDIVLHEVGHFVQDVLSVEDSPGGSHDGTPTDPLLAYSEGVATFFSCWVRQSDIYQDYRAEGWKIRQHEDLAEAYRGTSDGTIEGDVSEILVTALLWDLVDDDGQEPYDRLSGDDLVTDVLYRLLPSRGPDVGVNGVDLADFIDVARCQVQDAEALSDLIEATGYPFDFAAALDCID